MEEIIITDKTIDQTGILEKAGHGDAGAVNVFLGTVRNKTKDRKVLYLDYEAYEPMAIREMEKIVLDAKRKWDIINVVVHHRVGKLEIGEAAVMIALSTAHREASFQACKYIIDTLKETVPIWKREVFEDGEVWVAAHP